MDSARAFIICAPIRVSLARYGIRFPLDERELAVQQDCYSTCFAASISSSRPTSRSRAASTPPASTMK